MRFTHMAKVLLVLLLLLAAGCAHAPAPVPRIEVDPSKLQKCIPVCPADLNPVAVYEWSDEDGGKLRCWCERKPI